MEKKVWVVPGFVPLKGGGDKFERWIEEIQKNLYGVEIKTIDYLQEATYGKKTHHFLALIRERNSSIRDYAEKVAAGIDSENKNMIIIGYSLGGVIVRYLVEKSIIQPPKAVILVGCPNKGIQLLFWEKLLRMIIEVKFAEELLAPHTILEDITTIMHKGYNYYFIIGLKDRRVPLESSIPEIAEYINKEGWYEKRVYAANCGHRGLISEETARIIAEIIKKELNLLP